MKDIPANLDGSPADILAAWLYWETIVSDPSQLAGAQFRGHDLTVVQTNKLSLTGPFASCWGSQGPNPTFTMYQMRADVRRFLPLQYDANHRSTGKRLVNDEDLTSNNDPTTGQPFTPHKVSMPDAGMGNNAPVTAGASLVVVYRLRDSLEPLRKIVFYDGIAVLENLDGASLLQPLRGIYQSATDTSAMLTQIGASGQPNQTDRLRLQERRHWSQWAAAQDRSVRRDIQRVRPVVDQSVDQSQHVQSRKLAVAGVPFERWLR